MRLSPAERRFPLHRASPSGGLPFEPMASPVPEISPRHRFEARIDIRLRRGPQELSLQGWARDLSESGLRAFVADPLEKGESVVFEIPLSDIDKQVIPAKVVRV